MTEKKQKSPKKPKVKDRQSGYRLRTKGALDKVFFDTKELLFWLMSPSIRRFSHCYKVERCEYLAMKCCGKKYSIKVVQEYSYEEAVLALQVELGDIFVSP